MSGPLISKTWSNELLEKFFKEAAASNLFTEAPANYTVDGNPAIDTLPETFHVDAQPAQSVAAIAKYIVDDIQRLADAPNAQQVSTDRRTLIVGDPSPNSKQFYPYDLQPYSWWTNGAPPIDELPRGFRDAADGQSAACARDSGRPDDRADHSADRGDAVTINLYPDIVVKPYP